MALCPKCAATSEGKFCPKCGAPMTGGSPAPPGPVPVAMADNVAAVLCYLLLAVGGLLFLVLEPYNQKKAIRFHAFQSILFTIAAAIAWIIVIFLGVMLAYIPWIGPLIAGLLFLALFVGVFLIWIMLMYKAYNNHPVVLPVIGALAEKQA